MGKRIFLFILTNLAIVATLTIVVSLLGLDRAVTDQGLDLRALALFCFIYGMGGAFLSLQMSRWIAKRATGVQLVDGRTGNQDLDWLYATVRRLTQQANLPMPEVGIYNSPEVNAFATGPSKRRSLVAVSQGLMRAMRHEEVEGVLAHEVAHIANGDMVTMTLIQGVVNAFVMFLARAIAYAITMSRGNDNERSEGSPFLFHAVTMVLEIVFMILGSMVVAWFSRYREYRADAGGARLAGRDSMISALEALRRTVDMVDPEAQPSVAALKISSRPGGLMRLFSTHPPLEERVARLRSGI